MQWEYKVKSLRASNIGQTNDKGKQARKSLQRALNLLGAEGWEIVSIEPIGEPKLLEQQLWVLILKRPKP